MLYLHPSITIILKKSFFFLVLRFLHFTNEPRDMVKWYYDPVFKEQRKKKISMFTLLIVYEWHFTWWLPVKWLHAAKRTLQVTCFCAQECQSITNTAKEVVYIHIFGVLSYSIPPQPLLAWHTAHKPLQKIKMPMCPNSRN